MLSNISVHFQGENPVIKFRTKTLWSFSDMKTSYVSYYEKRGQVMTMMMIILIMIMIMTITMKMTMTMTMMMTTTTTTIMMMIIMTHLVD